MILKTIVYWRLLIDLASIPLWSLVNQQLLRSKQLNYCLNILSVSTECLSRSCQIEMFALLVVFGKRLLRYLIQRLQCPLHIIRKPMDKQKGLIDLCNKFYAVIVLNINSPGSSTYLRPSLRLTAPFTQEPNSHLSISSTTANLACQSTMRFPLCTTPKSHPLLLTSKQSVPVWTSSGGN